MTNTGSQSQPVVVQDPAPYGLVFTEATSQELTCQPIIGGLVTCEGDVAAQAAAVVKVKATAPAWVRPQTLTNCAWVYRAWLKQDRVTPSNGVNCAAAVASAQTDPWLAEATVDVVNDADLALTASHASQYDQVDPGKDAVVDFAVKNNGPSDASGPITVKGTLPAGLTFVSGIAPWSCAAAGQAVECTWMPVQPVQVQPNIPVPSGMLLAGASAPPLSWTVTTAKPGVVASYPVSATASSASADSKPANNTASTPIGVTPVDLAIEKSGSGPFAIDEQGVWNLSVTNVGTIDDAGVMTLVDTLPDGSSLVSAAGVGWNCTAAGFTVTCTHVGLTKGEVSELTVVTDVKSGFPEVTNNATVTSTSYEKETANNSTSAKVKVRRAAQTASPLPASPTRVKAGKTKQGQKLRTRVLCRPLKATAAGEVSFCKVKRSGGIVRVKVLGSRPMKVTVIQTAPGTDRYKPFVQRKSYIVRP